MAGVSAGTVDRVLHNRGNVSASSRAAVEKVLDKVGYKYNIHTSAVSLKKEFNIVIATPTAIEGEYWGTVRKGIENAIEEYSDIRLNHTYSYYSQFDVASCRESFDKIIDLHPDGVIIGPTFGEETARLCLCLDRAGIPYVFVDSVAEGTSPIATFTTDRRACGMVTASLLDKFTAPGTKLAVFDGICSGGQDAVNHTGRRDGFTEYFSTRKEEGRIIESFFSVTDNEWNRKNIPAFLEREKDLGGIAVINSRGHIMADLLKEAGLCIPLVSFDLTTDNVRCLNDGHISALLCQRPQLQGFQAVNAIIRYLLYRRKAPVTHNEMPIDIIIKENMSFYRSYFLS